MSYILDALNKSQRARRQAGIPGLHTPLPETQAPASRWIGLWNAGFVALAAAGIGEGVAPLGTALTEDQIERLWRLTECPVLCFDGDAAGQRAATRAIVRALPLLRPAKH